MATSIKISDIRGAGGDAPVIIGGGGEWISLKGPLNIAKGGQETYEITDYDDFSTYTVSASVGSASRTNENIVVDIPGGADGDTVTLTVTRNLIEREFVISLDSVSITSTPSITSPLNGEDGIGTSHLFKASSFKTVPAGAGTHTSSTWEIADDAGFSNVIKTTTISAGNKTQWNATGLPEDETLYVRVKYTSSIGDSGWSSTVTFDTIAQESVIAKPTVSVSGGTLDVGETPKFTTSVFNVTPSGTDSHVATTWVLRDDGDSVIWNKNNSTSNKTSITLPKSVLDPNSDYSIEAQHIGSFGISEVSDRTYFGTKEDFFPIEVGTPYGGGYFLGRIDVDDGNRYALIVAPKALGGESAGLQWKTERSTSSAHSINNGWTNTEGLNNASHPAAKFCRDLSINGYTDWYLPAKDELEMCYRYLNPHWGGTNSSSGLNNSSVPKGDSYTNDNPKQTDVNIFKMGNVEAFTSSGNIYTYFYWSSTAYTGYASAYGQGFNNGIQTTGDNTSYRVVRAIRRELIGPTPV